MKKYIVVKQREGHFVAQWSPTQEVYVSTTYKGTAWDAKRHVAELEEMDEFRQWRQGQERYDTPITWGSKRVDLNLPNSSISSEQITGLEGKYALRADVRKEIEHLTSTTATLARRQAEGRESSRKQHDDLHQRMSAVFKETRSNRAIAWVGVILGAYSTIWHIIEAVTT